MPINYTPDGAIRGNVAPDYVHKTPYTPYEPIDPKELLQVTDMQGQGVRGAGLLQKIKNTENKKVIISTFLIIYRGLTKMNR